MKLNDAVSGLLLLVLGLAVLVIVAGYPKIPGQNIGPSAFPALVGGLLVICSLLLIWRGWQARGAEPWIAFGEWVRSPSHVANFLLLAGSMLFYILLVDKLGFVLCGFIILVALFVKLGVALRIALPVALAVTLFIHTAFYKLLRVPLPWGWLQGVMWW